MYFLLLGIVGVALKYLEIGFVAQWNWWIVLIPFALAVAWWSYADASGYTKRKVMEKEERRRLDRIERQRSQLGMLSSRTGKKGRGSR